MPETSKAALSGLYRHFEHNAELSHARALLRLVRGEGADIGAAIRGHVLGDAWIDFSLQSLHAYFNRAGGYLYTAQTPQYPELFKVGKTRNSPATRVAQLSNEAILFKFQVERSYAVYDRHHLEVAVHRQLAKQGYPRLKEFFKVSASDLHAQILQVLENDFALLRDQGLQFAVSQSVSAYGAR